MPKVREETGRHFPPQGVTAFRLSLMVIGRLDDVSQSISRDLEFLGLLRIIALEKFAAS